MKSNEADGSNSSDSSSNDDLCEGI